MIYYEILSNTPEYESAFLLFKEMDRWTSPKVIKDFQENLHISPTDVIVSSPLALRLQEPPEGFYEHFVSTSEFAQALPESPLAFHFDRLRFKHALTAYDFRKVTYHFAFHPFIKAVERLPEDRFFIEIKSIIPESFLIYFDEHPSLRKLQDTAPFETPIEDTQVVMA